MADQRDGGISWCDETWNPIRGCSRVSDGCTSCYAERVAARYSGAGQPYHGLARFNANREPRWTGEVRLVPERLADPLRWKRPRRVFVNSMSDLFHERLTNAQIAAVFGVMADAPQHTFQVLTKRAERMLAWFRWVEDAHPAGALHRIAYDAKVALNVDGSIIERGSAWPLLNVWFGVSAENQAAADERIPLLLQCPAAVRWVSAEPLLGPIDFEDLPVPKSSAWHGWAGTYNALTGRFALAVGDANEEMRHAHLVVPETKLDWIVVGGESGPGARAFHVAWARDIVRQCYEAGVAPFVKQLGAYVLWNGIQGGYGDERSDVWPDNTRFCTDPAGNRVLLRDRAGSDPSEWPEDLRVREWPIRSEDVRVAQGLLDVTTRKETVT